MDIQLFALNLRGSLRKEWPCASKMTSWCTIVGFAPMISCLYAIEWRCIWTEILFSLRFHPQFELKKRGLRLKVRILRLWVVPSFGNYEVPNSMEIILLDEHCGKIQATAKKSLLNRFRDHIVEGQVYRMAYFAVVSNHGSYRTTSHEFKLVFFHRTTVVAVDEDVIPKTCFNMFPFSELLNITQDYDFLVDVIGLLTSVGEKKEYAKEGKIVKMIVLELISKDLTVQCALFGDYVNQVNHFLASGYVEQPVVVIQLAKVKFFRGQVGLQNVMYTTQMLFNPDLLEVVEFRQSMIEQVVNGTQPLFIANEGKVVSLEDDFMRLTRKCTIEEFQDNNEEGSFIIFGTIQGIVEDGGWWYSACVCGKGIYPQNGAYYCDFCLKHITNVTPRFKIKITLEDHSGEGIFLLFYREASYLLKKSCADLFTEVQRDASLICGDTYPPIFQGLIGKKLLLKEPDLHKSVPVEKDFLAEKQPTVSRGTEFTALINGEDGKDEKTPSNDTVSDDLSAVLDILLSSPEKETQEVLSHVLDVPSQYGEKLIHENHVAPRRARGI
ncbi:Replication protein A 70 kDa DNA-binding subunit C [Arachis hypogaea]|nr:Replication protein A 70 kDa DNA-binding subunit C [Arachis hypogaea]